MRVSELMRTRVETVSPREAASTALQRMRQARIRHLIVQDGELLVGVVSDRDITSLGSFGRIQTVEEVMSRPALTVSPQTTVRDAANLLRGRTAGCLPVVEYGKIVGIVTTTDLLESIGSEIERPVPKTRRWVSKDGARGRKVAGRGRTVRLPAPR